MTLAAGEISSFILGESSAVGLGNGYTDGIFVTSCSFSECVSATGGGGLNTYFTLWRECRMKSSAVAEWLSTFSQAVSHCCRNIQWVPLIGKVRSISRGSMAHLTNPNSESCRIQKPAVVGSPRSLWSGNRFVLWRLTNTKRLRNGIVGSVK